MSAPRRTLALVRAQRELERAQARLAAGERGFDPWRVQEARVRYDAALAAALADGPTTAPAPDDGIPRMGVGRFGR